MFTPPTKVSNDAVPASDRARVRGRIRVRPAARVCVAGVIVALAGPVAAAGAAVTPPPIDTSGLDAVLQAVPGITQGQLQALDGDLAALQSGTTPPTLISDVNSVLETLVADGGAPSAGQVLSDVLGTAPSTTSVEGLIGELGSVAGQSGVPSAVANAADALATALTTADLPALLGQGGNLPAATIQSIIGDLGALEGLAPGQSVPAGLLSGVTGALNTIASQPGVPAGVASTLENAAGMLSAGGSPASGLVGSVVPKLESVIPTLDAIPVVGPTLGSLVQTLATELAANGGNGANGGSGGNGANGGAGASGAAGANGGAGGAGASAGVTAATPPGLGVQAAHLKNGARIRSLSYRHGQLYVRLTCPSLMGKAGCKTTIRLYVGSWQTPVRTVTLHAGAAHTYAIHMPRLATTARGRRMTIAVTATTGSFTTPKHRLRVPVGR